MFLVVQATGAGIIVTVAHPYLRIYIIKSLLVRVTPIETLLHTLCIDTIVTVAHPQSRMYSIKSLLVRVAYPDRDSPTLSALTI